MNYFFIILALAATLAAALGETTRKTGDRKRLTWVGLVVVSAVVLTAVGGAPLTGRKLMTDTLSRMLTALK